MYPASKGGGWPVGLRSSDVARLVSSSNALVDGHLVPHAGIAAGEKTGRPQLRFSRSAWGSPRCCVGRWTTTVPRGSLAMQRVVCNATNKRGCITGKNITACHRDASARKNKDTVELNDVTNIPCAVYLQPALSGKR